MKRMTIRGALVGAMLALASASVQAQDAELVLRLTTGSDDLRGGNVDGTGNNLAVTLVSSGGQRTLLSRNANASATWTAGSRQEVRLPVGALGNVTGVELTLNDRLKADVFEQPDHWHLDALVVVVRVGRVERVLYEGRGAPLHRFAAGQSRTFAITRVVDSCASDSDCDDGVYCNGVEQCRLGQAPALRDCATDTRARCSGGLVCDEAQDRCRASTTDADGDGENSLLTGGRDCDDTDASRHPRALEVCDRDGKDEDCDLSTVGTLDADRDGHISSQCFNWGPPGGY